MPATFVKALRSREADELQETYPSAFLLLSLIARRATRETSTILCLQPGEALVGDYRKAGLTEQRYRTAKDQLTKLGIITCRSTNKGTIAKILTDNIYDINTSLVNDQTNGQVTDNQRTGNGQVTTNKKLRSKEYKNKEKELVVPADRPQPPKRSKLPEGFSLTPEMRRYASTKGINGECDNVFEAFTNHHRSKGSLMFDWTAAWRTWILNEIKFRPIQKQEDEWEETKRKFLSKGGMQ